MYLNVKGKDYKGQLAFKFRDLAEKKYAKQQGDSTIDGFTNIYSNLLEKDASFLLPFWDCALAHLKERPTVEEIEDALIEKAGDEQDYEPLLKEAFQIIDDSGFFRELVKKFWKQTDMIEDFAEDEKQKKAMQEEVQRLKKNRKELGKRK